MTNEKDREEEPSITEYDMEMAQKIVSAYVMRKNIPEIIARIRAEAVKSERECIKRRASIYSSDLLESKLIRNDKGSTCGKNQSLFVDAILSDDQGINHVQR